MQLTSPISCSQDLIPVGELGLQSIDVGAGAGDCFFRSVSHQLYGIIIQQIVTLSKYGHDALDICHP